MRVLFDTHTLIWAFDDPSKLSPTATSTILDPTNERFVSIASAWEIGIKVGLGKLSLSLPFRDWIDRALADLGAILHSISLDAIEALCYLAKKYEM